MSVDAAGKDWGKCNSRMVGTIALGRKIWAGFECFLGGHINFVREKFEKKEANSTGHERPMEV